MEEKRVIRPHWEKTPYEKWIEEQKIPVIRGMGVEDVTQVPRKLWPYLGCPAAFIQLDGMEGWDGMYMAEIPPGGVLNPEKHLYEEVIYVFKGRGLTEIGLKGKKQVFEWKEGSMFAPPLNTWHRLVNGTREPVILLVATNAPIIMDNFHNPDFIFNCDYEFKDRYREEEGYFGGEGERFQLGLGNGWQTNFIPDALHVKLEPQYRKVAKGNITSFYIAGNSLKGHIAEWPGGIYHKAHHHGGGAIILALSSKGYFLLWPSEVGAKPYQSGREDAVIQVNFKAGTIVSPATGWFHQRFNTGAERARQIAFTPGINGLFPIGAFKSFQKMEDGALVSIREGGTLLEYEDEDPEIRKRFEDALKQEGVPCDMPPIVYRD